MEKAKQILTIKNELKEALISKGIEVGDKFSEYPSKVNAWQPSSGEANCANPFEAIGYDEETYNELVVSAVEYSKSLIPDPSRSSVNQLYYNNNSLKYAPYFEIQDSWTNMNEMFYGCTSLLYVPPYDTSMVTIMSNMFNGCSTLSCFPAFDFSKVTSLNYAFSKCGEMEVPALTLPEVTSVSGLFYEASITKMGTFKAPVAHTGDYLLYNNRNLIEVPDIYLPECLSIDYFCYSGKYKTIGNIYIPKVSYLKYFLSYAADLVSVGEVEASSVNQTLIGSCYPAKLTFKNFGTPETMATIAFNGLSNWGDDSIVEGARQSLVDSLLTYSFDRASANYTACTIKLYSYALARLTEEEIAAITAKGYTLTT